MADPINFAAELVNTVNGDLSRFHHAGPYTDHGLVVAAMQVRATQAVAASLLAIADEMRKTREAQGAAGA